jgi:hypothetical protein
LRKEFSYRFAPDLAIERFDEEAILFVAERDALITINRGAADLFEAMADAFYGRTFDRREAAAWFERTFDLPPEDVQAKLLPVLAFAFRNRIIFKTSVRGALDEERGNRKQNPMKSPKAIYSDADER